MKLFVRSTSVGGVQWLSGRVLDRRRGSRVLASQVSLHCVLEQDINPSLVLVQPRKTCPYITERLLMGLKESNKTTSVGSDISVFHMQTE